MPIGLAAGLMLGGGAAKLLGGLFGARKRNKAAKKLHERNEKRLGEIEQAGLENYSKVEGVFKDTYEDLAGLKDFEIDTTYADAQYSDAQRSAQRQFGRASGEEIARDSTRQSTADSIAAARRTGSSTADLLGFLSESEARERSAMRNIDMSAIEARESRIDSAMGRLEGAAANRADFYQRKDMAEFEADRARALQMADFRQTSGMTLADISNTNQMNLIQARDAIAGSKSAIYNMQASNIDGIVGGIGDAAMGYGMMLDNRNFLSKTVGG